MAKKKTPSVMDNIINEVLIAVEEKEETIDNKETEKEELDLSEIPKKYWKNFNK